MRILLLPIFLLAYITLTFGQDPQFTQFYSNPLYQSPSFTGAIEGYRASLNYRDQWPSLPGKLTTATFSFDYNVSAINSGIGLFVMNDIAGSAAYRNMLAGFLYSYNVMIKRRVYFRPGVGFYYSQRSIDYSKLIFSSQIETGGGASPILPSEMRNVSALDGSLSGVAFIYNFWLGLTADHLAMPNKSFTKYVDRLPVKYTLFGGYRFYKFERLIGAKRQSVTLAGNYRHQGITDQVDLGLYWSYDPFVLGVWYRDLPFIKDYSRRDALALLCGYKFEGLSVGYSYDFTLSRMITSTGGAHEISLIYKFEIEQKKKFKPIPCPTF